MLLSDHIGVMAWDWSKSLAHIYREVGMMVCGRRSLLQCLLAQQRLKTKTKSSMISSFCVRQEQTGYGVKAIWNVKAKLCMKFPVLVLYKNKIHYHYGEWEVVGNSLPRPIRHVLRQRHETYCYLLGRTEIWREICRQFCQDYVYWKPPRLIWGQLRHASSGSSSWLVFSHH